MVLILTNSERRENECVEQARCVWSLRKPAVDSSAAFDAKNIPWMLTIPRLPQIPNKFHRVWEPDPRDYIILELLPES